MVPWARAMAATRRRSRSPIRKAPVSHNLAALLCLTCFPATRSEAGFDSALFKISLNSVVIDSQSFTDLASAESFFSNHLINVPLLAGLNSVQLVFTETMSSAGGFSFDYAVASQWRLERGSRPHRRCWPSRPDLGGRWPSRLVATAAENRGWVGWQMPRVSAGRFTQLDL